MARVPDIIRRNTISQVAATPKAGGMGWSALADLAQAGAEFVKPAAVKEASEAGLKSVYRAPDGSLKVKEASVLGGEMADLHNTAAYAKYMAQRKIDMSQSFTEMARKNEFNPAGFQADHAAYVKLMQEDEQVPVALKEELLLDAQEEGNRRFNGLYDAEIDRTNREADRNTSTLRDMLSDDYVSLVMGGDMVAAEAKLKEIEELSRFRSNAPYITETEAETQAYIRGTKGAAKAAALAQRLQSLEGATSITDEMKSEIDAVLKDPDLSPDARQKLMSAASGRLKGIEANGIAAGLANDTYAAKVTRAESGGSTTAKNPNSSATGLHQFISGTWMENVRELQRQGGADWALGMSNDEILEMRKNGAASQEVFGHFTAKNQNALASAGMPVNDATTYMAHFFGSGGAIKVLSSDPGAMVKDILPDIIAANPFLTNMTVADAQNWAARNMTMKASDIAHQQVYVDQIDDVELRAMASDALSERFQVRKRIEDASADEYEQRLAAKDDTMTEQEVLQDHNLSDTVQQAIVKGLQTANKDKIEVQQTISRLSDPSTPWDIFDSDQRKSVDKAYGSMLGENTAASPEGRRLGLDIAARTGFLPRQAFNSLRAGIYSKDPAVVSETMEYANSVLQTPGAIDMHDGAGAVKDALADYRFLSGFMGQEEAGSRMVENNSPEAMGRRKNLSEAAKDAAEALKPADVISHLSQSGVSAELGTDIQQGEMMDEYTRLFTEAYASTGSTDLAKNRALEEVSRVYGPDGVTGSARIMKYPPQNFYVTPPGVDPNWMQTQLEDDVSKLVYGDEAGVQSFQAGLGVFDFENKVSADDIIIMSDEMTRADIAAGRPPRYRLMYADQDGILQQAAQPYRFAPPAAPGIQDVAKLEALQGGVVEKRNQRAWAAYLIEKHGISEASAMMVADPKKYSSSAPPKE